ncbi:MAG: EamA/RhaT family transporter, partial [Shimia sp.]|nr:EamA/RhaT family transporter [Shimia sp.]
MGTVTFGAGAWLLLVAQAQTDPVTVAIIAAATPVAGTVIEV